ncbi:30S ribosomal protein S2 [Patescibacteria group bacterium]|nr:30S ribosomal protein S2 [Patescibacteria group bacterium]
MARKMKDDISLKEMLAARVHLGHRARRWNPRMKRYVYTKQAGIHIIDLILTRKCLREARQFLKETVEKGGKLLLLSTKVQARQAVKKWAEKANCYYLIERWPGGLLTNFVEVQRGVERLRQIKELKDSSKWEDLSTRRQCQITREIRRQSRLFGGIEGMEKLPEVLFVVDPKREKNAVKEAIKTGIPVVAIIDTDANPDVIDYPIPANDDASRSIDLMLGLTLAELVDGDVVNEVRQTQAETPVGKVLTRGGQESKGSKKSKGTSGDKDLITSSALPQRVKDALTKAGYDKLGEVKKLTKEELMQVKGVGEKAAEAIVES